MKVRVEQGAIVREFDLYLAVAIESPRTVELNRVTDHSTNQVFTATWTLSRAGSTRIALDLDATLRVPPLIPTGGIADAIAEMFVTAACRALGSRSG
jgi:hypothetical protein